MNEDDRRLLPPLAMLHALEAAARHGSFSRAGDALGLTQSAVSRQIAALEDWLGVALFDRHGRRVALNARGHAYLEEVVPALSRLRRATARLMAPRHGHVMEIASLPGFGMRWLAPRLPSLTARHPDIVVNIAARTDIFDFAHAPYDAAIHVGAQPDWPGVVHDTLFREEVVPVIAPALAQRHNIAAPADFLRVPLLAQALRRDDWSRWLAMSGLSLPPRAALSSFEHFLMLAQAAVAGAGAALLPSFLIEPELASGALVSPVRLPLVEERNYYLVYPEERLADPAFARFRAWMVAEAAASGAV